MESELKMRRRIIEFLVLAVMSISVAIGSGPVGAAFWSWSTTPGSNATADPSINWSEGQAPSSVNDSARSMMAVLAAWRIDNGGSLVTTGTSTAYVLATSQPFGSASDLNGQSIAFIITPTNGVNPTLNVNGVGAFPLVTENGAPVPSGSMHDGRIYHVTFSSANSVFRVHDNFENSFSIPLGGILWSTAPTAPNSNFVAPSGQCISTTTYAAYWVQQGSPASGACPGGQFAIIDMRGRVAAALDTLNALAAGRLTNSATGCGTAMTAVGAVCAATESTMLATTQIPSHTHVASAVPDHRHFTVADNNVATTLSPSNRLARQLTGAGDLSYNLGGHADDASVGLTSLGGGHTPVLANTGGGGAHTNVQPTIGLIPYLRVL